MKNIFAQEVMDPCLTFTVLQYAHAETLARSINCYTKRARIAFGEIAGIFAYVLGTRVVLAIRTQYCDVILEIHRHLSLSTCQNTNTSTLYFYFLVVSQ